MQELYVSIACSPRLATTTTKELSANIDSVNCQCCSGREEGTNDKFIVSDQEDVSAKQGDKGDMNDFEDHAHDDLLRHGSEIELEDEAHV